jgi:ribosome-binding factor A
MTGTGEGRRQKRVSNLIQEALGRALIQDVQPLFACLVTVTRVEMPPDLKTATVFLSVMGEADQTRVLESLRQRTGHFRKILASSVKLKYNPELFFVLDPVPEYESRIDELIALTKKSHDET